jgi:Head fiber protein.
MSYNAKNYTEQGGEKTVIGGTLEIKEGASVTGLSSFTAAVNQASSTATDISGLVADFNALLSALKTAGLMLADT